MSENSKKRCRKSKLVPRTYDLDDGKVEDDDASPNVKEISSKLLKIKQEIENDDCISIQDTISSPLQNYVANPLQNYMTSQNYIPSPIQFSIKVEVEECDDLDFGIIKKEITEQETLAKTETLETRVSVPSISDIDISKEADNLLLKTENIDLNPNFSECINSPLELEPIDMGQDAIIDGQDLIIDIAKEERLNGGKYIVLSEEDILNYQPDPEDVPGKLLCIEIRNIMGRVRKDSLEMDRHEKLIQVTLEQNKLGLNQFNDVIFTYKCYICKEAWWHLYPFREHIRKHDDANLVVSMEFSRGQEINMIAFTGTVPKNTDIEIHSNCWHCGKNYSIHKQIESSIRFTCSYCTETFVTCTQLIMHEGVCFWHMHKMLEDDSQSHICPYCLIVVFCNTELNDHLILRHSVRSDVPMPVTFKHCPYCRGIYFNFNSHVCPKRTGNKACLYCNRKFPNKVLWDAHLLLTKNDVNCPICGIVLAKECMMSSHILEEHSTDFTVCTKCSLCVDFLVFIDDVAQREHRLVHHKLRYDRRRSIFEMVVIPKILLLNPLEAPPRPKISRKILVDLSCAPKKKRKPNFKVLLEACGTNAFLKAKMDMNNEIENNVEVENNVVIKTEQIEAADNEHPDYESIIQINQIGKIKNTEQDEIKPEDYINVSDIKTEVEDIDCVEGKTTDYEQLLSNVFRVSENFTNMRNEVKSEPLEENDDNIEIADEKLYLEPEVILKPGYRKRKIYTCCRCGYKGYHKEYRIHLKNKCETVKVIEQKNGKFGCTKCNKNFDSMKRYLDHLSQHGYKCYTCPECSEHFETLSSLTGHVNYHVRKSYVKLLIINRSSRNTKVLQCKKCKGKVVLDNFFAHWESHLELGHVHYEDEMEKYEDTVSTALEPEVLKELIKLLVFYERGHRMKIVKNCNVCHRHFDRVNDCKRHLIEHLLVDAYANKPRNKMLKCQICCEGFRKADGYKQHMRDHGSLPVYRCEICNKTFSDSSNFTKHKKIHNLRVLVCDICGKKFQAKLSIEKHMAMHLTTDPIMCKECPKGKMFYAESALKKHIRNYHDKTKLKYRCCVCAKRFLCLKDKWDHMWLVHKERKEKADCPICDKSFRKYNDVKAHVRNAHEMGVTVFNMKLFDTATKRQMAEALQKSLLGVKKENNAMEDETLIVFE